MRWSPADRQHLLGERGQDLAARLGDDDEILDAATADTGKVETGLDADDVSRGEHVGRLGPEHGRLVDLGTDAVAEAVTVVLCHPGRRDGRARCGIDVHPVFAGANGSEPVELGLGDEPVDLGELIGDLAGRERARAVGAVAVDDAAHVDRHERPLRDHGVSGMRVRRRTVQSRRDDRVERQPVRAELAERPLDPPGEVLLGSSDERLLGEGSVDGVRDRASAANRVDLAVVLDETKGFDEPAGRNELRAAAPDRLPLGIRDARRLEPDAAPREQLGESAGNVTTGLHDLDALDRARRLEVAEVRVQRRRSVRLDEHGTVRALEAEQVADVDAVGDEERLAEPAASRAMRLTGVAPPAARAPRDTPRSPCPRPACLRARPAPRCRRHSSRASTFERCTSTNGTVNGSSASWIAHE